VASAYGLAGLAFGPEYLIPKPFDPRLMGRICPAVAKAAMDSGVATRPLKDLDAYRQQLQRFVYQSGPAMEPVFDAAKRAPKRVAYAEGEDERVLRAAQTAVDEGIARPVLVGRADVIAARIDKLGLRLQLGRNAEVVNVLDDPRYADAWKEYYEIAKRDGVTRAIAREEMRSRTTLIGAILVRRGDADAMLCGTSGDYGDHLKYVRRVIGLRDGVANLAAMQMLILPGRQLFVCDTHVNRDPTAEQIAEVTLLAAAEVRRFGLAPIVALVSHSSFGSSDAHSARKMRDALKLINQRAPDLEVEGEMRGDAALSKTIRDNEFPDARLSADANLLVMPNIDAANITYNVLRVVAGGGITVGGILLGAARPVHIMTPSSTVRRIVNMTALATADAVAARGDS
jgi:malate dehydrogenase (oxaloacetate-decarboxylating)(NADP+)